MLGAALPGVIALVMVPRLVNIDSWLDDLARHSDLEPNPVMVENIEEKRYRLLHPVGDITVVGPLARSARDLASMMKIIAGPVGPDAPARANPYLGVDFFLSDYR